MTRHESRSDLIMTPQEVEAGLAAGRFRVIDASVWFETKPVGASTIHSGREHFLRGHVPGAAYLHMVEDLSDASGRYPFTIAPQAQIDRVLSEIGIRPEDTVVVYGAGTPVAVTRAWWVLSVSGLADVRIMDGGWQRWLDEGRPVASGPERFERSDFRGQRRKEAIATRADIEAALRGSGARLVNALSAEQFAGSGGTHYGRPGRIPGSVSCPAADIVDPATGRFRPLDEIRRRLEPLGDDRPIITYCGGGIAATAAYFALHAIGRDRLSVYDNSLLEWSAEPDLPMEKD